MIIKSWFWYLHKIFYVLLIKLIFGEIQEYCAIDINFFYFSIFFFLASLYNTSARNQSPSLLTFPEEDTMSNLMKAPYSPAHIIFIAACGMVGQYIVILFLHSKDLMYVDLIVGTGFGIFCGLLYLLISVFQRIESSKNEVLQTVQQITEGTVENMSMSRKILGFALIVVWLFVTTFFENSKLTRRIRGSKDLAT